MDMDRVTRLRNVASAAGLADSCGTVTESSKDNNSLELWVGSTLFLSECLFHDGSRYYFDYLEMLLDLGDGWNTYEDALVYAQEKSEAVFAYSKLIVEG